MIQIIGQIPMNCVARNLTDDDFQPRRKDFQQFDFNLFSRRFICHLPCSDGKDIKNNRQVG